MSNESNWPEWVELAENDLLDIQNNLASKAVPWNTVCFHAQQAAEKLLKAFLIVNGVAPLATHDLVRLLDDCLKIDPALKSLEGDCFKLTYYAVDSRYPGRGFKPQEEEGLSAHAASLRIAAAVKSRLPK